MPLVKYSALVTRMSGKLNGSVFAFNQGGDYFRNNKQGKGKTSSRWQQNKALWANLSAQWRLLPDADKSAWVAIAPEYPTTNRFGVPRTPSGYELFMRLNGAMVMNELGCCLTPDNPEEEDDLGVLTPAVTTNAAPFSAVFNIHKVGAEANPYIYANYSGFVFLPFDGSLYFASADSDAANIARISSFLSPGWSVNVVSGAGSTWTITFTLDPDYAAIGGTVDFTVASADWTNTPMETVIKPTTLINVVYSLPVGDTTAVCAYTGSYEARGARPKPGLQKRMANQTDNGTQYVDISIPFYLQYGAAISGGTVNGYLRVINTHTGQQGVRRWYIIQFP
jgi:hypothetical protein